MRRSLLLLAVMAFGAGASALGVPMAAAAPRASSTIHWYRWHVTTPTHEDRLRTSGSLVVVGLAANRDGAALRQRYGIAIVQALPRLRAVVVRGTRALFAHAASDPSIRYVSSLGSSQSLLSLPNDPLLSATDRETGSSFEWQFAAANMEQALDLSAGSASVVVGTIDSGVAEVPDLAGKVDARWTVSAKGKLRRDRGGNDFAGHGTAVASLIAANVGDGFGMAGFGGASHVIAIRATTLNGVAVAAALMKLDALGARIVNMSFGSPSAEPPIVIDAIHRVAADGLLLIAAAGNSRTEVAHPAADLQPVGGARGYGLAVGASDSDGNLAFFSNFGDHLSLLAPGADHGPCSGVLVATPVNEEFVNACYPSWTDDNGASYAYAAGTSFAAPEVAGVAALVWSARPDLTNYQVAEIIKQSAQRPGGWATTTGWGVLDAGAAVARAISWSAG